MTEPSKGVEIGHELENARESALGKPADDDQVPNEASLYFETELVRSPIRFFFHGIEGVCLMLSINLNICI